MSEGVGQRDPKALRALAHPLRWKLIDLLAAESTATATRCAEALGESVASCSYHLNILAKYGYVEPAPTERGPFKPWRLTSVRQSWSADDSDPEMAVAAEAVTDVFLDHEMARLKAHLRRRDREEPVWRQATGSGGVTTFLTAAELQEITGEMRKVIDRYADRLADPRLRPEAGREVRIFFATSIAPPRTPDA